MSKKKKIIFIILIAIVLVFVSSLFYFKSICNRPMNINKTILLDVEEGEGLSTVIEKLDSKGYLRNKYLFKLKVKMDYKNVNTIPGTYKINKNITISKLIKLLETENVKNNLVKVTVPEGYTIDSIAELFEEKGLFKKDEFIKAVKMYKLPSYVKDNKEKKYNLEGYLYPNTYYFNKKSTPYEVIDKMIEEFQLALKEAENEAGCTVSENDIENLIVKASLIEKEVKDPKEKAIVSSVINNRIKKNMKLQFCSTVNYLIGYKGHEVLSYDDIKIDSPYNTYKYTGLPVGPISNPGKESIIAALKPANTEYLYFVLSEDNKTHYFSKTEEEHNKAKEKAETNRKK